MESFFITFTGDNSSRALCFRLVFVQTAYCTTAYSQDTGHHNLSKYLTQLNLREKPVTSSRG